MTICQTTMDVDLDVRGSRDEKLPFHVRLRTVDLSCLIRDAVEDAYRIHELFMIERPGDILDYVWVVPEELTERVEERVLELHGKKRSVICKDGAYSRPEHWIPFKDFDRLFYYVGDDTYPEDGAWRDFCDSRRMLAFAREMLAVARNAQNHLGWNDALLRHISSTIRAGEHAYCYLDRPTALKKSREFPPTEEHFTPAFYAKLNSLLGDANLVSVACRTGDYRVLRMMATEQRRRANRTGHGAENALFLAAINCNTISNEAWDSKIWLFDEGLAHGDLLIDNGGAVKKLVEEYQRVPGRWILSPQDEGSIAGFTSEAGEGWVLYTRQTPDTRREALQKIDFRRSRRMGGSVLSFAEKGATLFGSEKTVIFVGAEVSTAARSLLARMIAEWQQEGGDPLLVVMGQTMPFDAAGCQGILAVDAAVVALDDENALADWLVENLRQSRPWIDAVISLRAPAWAARVLAACVQDRRGLWSAWVVASEGESSLKADFVLAGALEQVLLAARRRAKPSLSY
jgi:hypothetical protein